MTSKPRVCVAIEPDLIATATGEAAAPAVERVEAHVTGCRMCRDDLAHYRAIDSTVGALRATAPPARTRLDWPLDFRGARSPFERAVLEATAAVPYGAVASYTGIAGQLGKPAAVRAVAQALRHNPLPIVVPCHRIVGSRGELVGYAGNRVGLKERLLGLEGVPTEPARGTRIARAGLYHYEPNPGREYCLPTCGDIARRPIGMLVARREHAEARGLVPCTTCRPELHPLPE
jgi:O-6-methylguanine DNA methyltransferase